MQVKETGEKYDVLLVSINPGGPNGGSATQYFVGAFDGEKFTPHPSHQNKQPVWLDYGRDNYAGVTWNNIPAADGRRLFIGWMSNWDYAQEVPTTVWRSAMTLPRSLSLHKLNNLYRLQASPVKETAQLREQFEATELSELTGSVDLTPRSIQPQQSEWVIEAELTDAATETLYLQFSNAQNETYTVGYDVKKNHYFSNRTKAGTHSFSEKFAPGIHIAPRVIDSKRIRLHLFIDASSVELFADDGFTCITDLLFASAPFTKVELIVKGGKLKMHSIAAHGINRIW
jgi:fructan beta-fructosidase